MRRLRILLTHPRLGIILASTSVTVEECNADARPARVSFSFHVLLEDPSLRWLVWEKGSYQPFTPPDIGDTIKLPGSRLF